MSKRKPLTSTEVVDRTPRMRFDESIAHIITTNIVIPLGISKMFMMDVTEKARYVANC